MTDPFEIIRNLNENDPKVLESYENQKLFSSLRHYEKIRKRDQQSQNKNQNV